MSCRRRCKSVVEVAMEAFEQRGRSMQGVHCNLLCAKGHLFRHRSSNASIERTCQFVNTLELQVSVTALPILPARICRPSVRNRSDRNAPDAKGSKLNGCSAFSCRIARVHDGIWSEGRCQCERYAPFIGRTRPRSKSIWELHQLCNG